MERFKKTSDKKEQLISSVRNRFLSNGAILTDVHGVTDRPKFPQYRCFQIPLQAIGSVRVDVLKSMWSPTLQYRNSSLKGSKMYPDVWLECELARPWTFSSSIVTMDTVDASEKDLGRKSRLPKKLLGATMCQGSVSPSRRRSVFNILAFNPIPVVMSFPNKAERQKCWDSRDRYWECLDVNKDENEHCLKLRQLYESSCSSQWSHQQQRIPPSAPVVTPLETNVLSTVTRRHRVYRQLALEDFPLLTKGLVWSLSYSPLVSAGTLAYRACLKDIDESDWMLFFMPAIEVVVTTENNNDIR
uniref:Uncharacterized protein n=1 Tax=Timema tahoe TaxID=61484 RepID=A0A7R9IAT9_9NEOP|nr:unnamed protein product [Timema tahoe]